MNDFEIDDLAFIYQAVKHAPVVELATKAEVPVETCQLQRDHILAKLDRLLEEMR